jgi:hypothetical protein
MLNMEKKNLNILLYFWAMYMNQVRNLMIFVINFGQILAIEDP